MLNRETGQPEHVSTPWRAMMPTPRRHGLALLASAFAMASAQAPNDDYVSGQPVHVSTAMIALLAAVIAVFVFIAFSTIYLRHCTGYYDARTDFDGRAAVHLDRHTFVSRSRRQRGLDAEVVETFPTMRYAEAKALQVDKGGALECAVCLSEFEDEERLRLLPKCSHAFHPDCIGQWLASHVTCPVCRCNLDPNKQDTSSDEDPRVPGPAPQPNNVPSETTSLRQDDSAQAVAVVIDVVTEEDEDERRREEIELQQIGSQRRAMRSRSGTPARLERAHSTGRSFAVRLDRDMERFTLRLLEHVRREMVAAGEHSLQSLRGRRAGEGSSRGGRSGPLCRVARWQSLLVRTFSGKVSFFSASSATVSSDGGEVSSTSSSRARGKRVAAVDADAVPDRGGIRLERIGGRPSGAKAGTVPHEAADEEKAVAQQVPT
jgi:E3 ubiquitin-protein ligase ATL6/9/15/31/42/55